MKNKILVWSVVSILVLGLGAGVYFWFFAPQTIVLDDGTKLTLVEVSYGKHHTLHKKDKRGRPIRASFNSTNDTLCLWIEQKHSKNNWPNYELLAFDGGDTGCAGNSSMTYANGPGRDGTDYVGQLFEAFPRRGWKIHFRAKAWNNRNGGQQMGSGHFSIHNPARSSSFKAWSSNPLPNAQSADDLDVTMVRLERNQDGFDYGQKIKSHDASTKGVLMGLRVEQRGNAVTNWAPVAVETTDGTGNRCYARNWNNYTEGDVQMMKYQYGLWPDEPAWKLRIEMSRSSGFTSDEMWTARGITFKPGDMNDIWGNNNKKQDSALSETTLGETHLQIFPVIQFDKSKARMYGDMDGVFRIHADPPPEGMRMTIIKVTDEQDKPVNFYNWGWGGGDYRFALRNLGDAHSINITLAFHRSRYFEFVAKPK